MTKQAKTGYIGAYLAAMGRQQRHQARLALLHKLQGFTNPAGFCFAKLGRGKQHSRANGAADQQHITRLQGPLKPRISGKTIHGEGQQQLLAQWFVCLLSHGLEAVAAEQLGAMLSKHTLNTGKALA